MIKSLKINPEMASDENPEWTEKMFDQAKPASEITELQPILKATRGRPKVKNPKKTISIRLSDNILDYFKAGGKGWQTRINEVLSDYVASR